MHKLAHSNLLKRLVPALKKESLISSSSTVEIIGNAYPFLRNSITVKYTHEGESFEFDDVFDFLMKLKDDIQNQLRGDFSEINWRAFIAEMRNCLANDILFLEHRLQIESQIAKKFNKESQIFSLEALNKCLFLESFVSVGHPIHPGYKVKLGFSEEELLKYSPEFEQAHNLYFAALHKSITKISSPVKNFNYEYELKEAFPLLMEEWSQELSKLNLNPSDYAPIPLHPWQKEHVIQAGNANGGAGTVQQSKFSELISTKKLIVLEKIKEKVRPTLSLRTLAPLNSQRYHIKVPINAQMTSVKRSIPPSNVYNGPLFSDYIKKIIKEENHFGDQFDFIEDEFGIIVDPCTQLPYDETRQLCAIFRKHPSFFAQDGEFLLPLAGLFITSPIKSEFTKDEPIVLKIIKSQYGNLAKSSIIKFFENYTELILNTQLKMYLKYGIALEAHQQNSFLLFKSNDITKFIVRDSSDIEFYEEKLQTEKLAFEPHFKTYQIKKDISVCRQTLIHTMFYSNLLFLIEALSMSIKKETLLAILKSKVKQTFEGAKEYMSEEEYKEELFHILKSKTWPVNSLLRMRLTNTEQCVAMAETNPLYN